MQTPKNITSEFGALKHPTQEEWMDYLYGEMPRSSAAAVRRHLETCTQCQSQYGAMANTQSRLNRWSLVIPPVERTRASVVNPLVKWAMAALVVLGLGYTAGLRSAPRLNPEQVRAAIEPSLRAAVVKEVRQEVEQQVRADWLAVTGDAAESLTTPFRRELRERLDDWRTQVATAGAEESRRLVFEFAQQYRTDRQEDRQATLTLFNRAEAEHLRLRRDVETIAVVTDDQFQRTESQLGRLATYAQAKLTMNSLPNTVEP